MKSVHSEPQKLGVEVIEDSEGNDVDVDVLPGWRGFNGCEEANEVLA